MNHHPTACHPSTEPFRALTCVLCGGEIAPGDLPLAWTRVIDVAGASRVEHAHGGCAGAQGLESTSA